MIDQELIVKWWMPAALTAGGIVIGIVLKLLFRKYEPDLQDEPAKRAAKIFIWGLIAKAPIWGFMVGLFLALEYILVSESAHLYLINLVYVLLITIVTWTVAGLSGELIAVGAGGEERTASTTIFKVLLKIGVWGIGLSIGLQKLGISIAPILTALGVGGLAVALALQDTLSNLFSGIQIILAKQMSVGDYIRLDSGEAGYVEDINWRNTTIRELPGNLVIIPNSKLASSIITNFNMPLTDMNIAVDFGVAYGSDLDLVQKTAHEVAREAQLEVEGAIDDYDPPVRLHTFADSSINCTVIMRISDFTIQWNLRTVFIKKLHERFEQKGIEIPFPQRVITVQSNSIDTRAE